MYVIWVDKSLRVSMGLCKQLHAAQIPLSLSIAENELSISEGKVEHVGLGRGGQKQIMCTCTHVHKQTHAKHIK